MISSKTVIATTSSFGAESPEIPSVFSEHGLSLITNPTGRKLSERELQDLLQLHKPVGLLAGTEPVTCAVLEQSAQYLRVISRVGVGWDNVDREAAGKLGILVYRTSGVLTDAVAELTIGLVLLALRSVSSADRKLRSGVWQKQMGSLLLGKTVGVVGFGQIGQRVGKLADAFGAKVIFHDLQLFDFPWARAVSLGELLCESDIVTLHASGQNRVLGQAELRSLKKGSIVLNTARGGLVDENALHDCLLNGRVRFACLDVFENEPYNGPLCSLENVVLTPHIGSYAREARVLMEQTAVENLLDGLRKAGVL